MLYYTRRIKTTTMIQPRIGEVMQWMSADNHVAYNDDMLAICTRIGLLVERLRLSLPYLSCHVINT